MSEVNIAPLFEFRRMKISGHSLSHDYERLHVSISPDERTIARCHQCATLCRSVHSETTRPVRDLDVAGARVWLDCTLRKAFCPTCGRVMTEGSEACETYKRVTPRMARFVHDLCKRLSVADVARQTGLDWKSVQAIDKTFLESQFGEPNLTGLRILAVDEIAVKKGHRYMSVVLDYETGRVVWMGQDRKQATLEAFFDLMSDEQRAGVLAVAMDMWDPFIAAVRAKLPNARIVFDLFHVVSAFGKVLDRVRIDEAKKATDADKAVYKGSKYLLLKNAENLKRDEPERLRRLLDLNAVLCTTMILRDGLKKIWDYRSPFHARRALQRWCALARGLKVKAIDAFAKMLERHVEGIVSHSRFPIHTSRLEGVNNKIKVIKRKAYGFHNMRYFHLKVIQAFAPAGLN